MLRFSVLLIKHLLFFSKIFQEFLHALFPRPRKKEKETRRETIFKIDLNKKMNLPEKLIHLLLEFRMSHQRHHQMLVLRHQHVNNVANSHISTNEISEIFMGSNSKSVENIIPNTRVNEFTEENYMS